jgi:hypothetical protein
MKFLVPFALILSQLMATDAFVTGTLTPSTRMAFHSAASNAVRQSTYLRVGGENEESPDTEASAAGAGQEMEEETSEPEDPELKAVREEIEQLESTLKERRRELAYVSDKAEEYTKSGYARKVAEMENMRRARSVSIDGLGLPRASLGWSRLPALTFPVPVFFSTIDYRCWLRQTSRVQWLVYWPPFFLF